MNNKNYEDLISYIVPVYNSEKYLRQCLDSITGQTYTNLEIILVDDGSTDASPVICDEYAKRDSRIRVIHQLNAGQGMARNAALDVANGKYIGFADSDDWLKSDMIEILYHIMMQNQTDIACCETIDTNEDGTIRCNHGSTDVNSICCTKDALNIIFEDKKYKSYLWNKLFRAELWNGIRFEQVRAFEDYTIIPLIFSKAKSISFIDSGLYFYRQHDSATSYSCNLIIWDTYMKAVLQRIEQSKLLGVEYNYNSSTLDAAYRYKQALCRNSLTRAEFKSLCKNANDYLSNHCSFIKLKLKQKIKYIIVRYFTRFLRFI